MTKLQGHPAYHAAKEGDMVAAFQVVEGVRKPSKVPWEADEIVAVAQFDRDKKNALPIAYAILPMKEKPKCDHYHPTGMIVGTIAGTHRYQLTPLGRRTALFYSRTFNRVVRPGLSEIANLRRENGLESHRFDDHWRMCGHLLTGSMS